MARFIDIHTGMTGIDKDGLMAAHQLDLDAQNDEGVQFLHAWADPTTGKVFCLSEGPDRDAVQRVHEKAGHAADEIYEVSIDIE